MSRQGPEARLIQQMRDTGRRLYGKRLVIVKYHGNEYSEAGVSDLLCCLDGTFLAVEVKSPTGKYGVTIKQAAFMDRVADAGGYVAVCRSVDQFMRLLASVSRNEDEDDGQEEED